MQNYKLERVVKTELTGRSLLMGEGPHWAVVPSKEIKKMKKNNVSGPLIIVAQLNDIRKLSHDLHVDVPYCIRDDLLSYVI
jgi:hypothetical protein